MKEYQTKKEKLKQTFTKIPKKKKGRNKRNFGKLQRANKLLHKKKLERIIQKEMDNMQEDEVY